MGLKTAVLITEVDSYCFVIVICGLDIILYYYIIYFPLLCFIGMHNPPWDLNFIR